MIDMDEFTNIIMATIWPICILLWTIMALISLIETFIKHRYQIKKLTARLDKLERLERKVAETNKKINLKKGWPLE